MQRPPVDWCDSSLLIPHEALRHELQAMLKSIEKLSSAEPTDSWRTVNFCRWFVEVLVPVIHSHHDNEELIFFPAIKARAQMPDRVRLGKNEEDGCMNMTNFSLFPWILFGQQTNMQ